LRESACTHAAEGAIHPESLRQKDRDTQTIVLGQHSGERDRTIATEGAAAAGLFSTGRNLSGTKDRGVKRIRASPFLFW
jgi:hypothetical protein